MRRGLASLVVLGTLLLSSGTGAGQTPPPLPPNPCQDPLEELLCPDLVMSAPYDITIDRKTERGHVLLRATSSINNHGTGPLELRGHRRSARSMSVTQIIYRANGTRKFLATKALLGFKFVSGRRYGFTFPNFRYWKFRGAARFQLWSLDSEDKAVKLIRIGPKLFYCFRDLTRTKPSRHSPRQPVYPACSQNPNQRRVTLGTSVGWSDVYPYTYPEQYVDVTGLRGRFAYVMVADPFNRLVESNELNNVSETFVQLPSGRVLGTRVGVAAP
ncbi:MAG TPA: hypothetical protein VF032_00980 [Thermoleophilaceae bacterium]